MPSLWNWLPRRKHASEIPDSSDKRQRRSGPIKRLFSGNSREEVVLRSHDAHADLHRHTAIQEQPVFPHMAPKTRGIEKSLEEDKDDGLKKLEDLLEGNNQSPRRRLVYEIFEDQRRPRKLTDPPTFLSQPCLGQAYESAYKQKDDFPRYFTRERDVYPHVEMKKKSPNIFAGLVSRGQRHNSMYNDYPGPGRSPRMGMEARRSESMYAYVPKAVSLHDASALLLGQEKEQSLPSTQKRPPMNHFAQSPEWITRMPQMNPYSTPFPQNTPPARGRSVSSGHQPERTGPQFLNGHIPNNPPVQRTRSVNQNRQLKQATGNENFYFSSALLSPERDRSHSDHSHHDNGGFITSGRMMSLTGIGHQVTSSGANKNNRSSNSDNGFNNKISSANTNNNFWFGKADLTGVGHSISEVSEDKRNNNDIADDESDVTSLLEQFDQMSGIDNPDNSERHQPNGRTGVGKLEGIFSTAGEVLY